MNYLLLWFLYIAVFDWQNYTLYAVIKTVSKFITYVTLSAPVLYFYVNTFWVILCNLLLTSIYKGQLAGVSPTPQNWGLSEVQWLWMTGVLKGFQTRNVFMNLSWAWTNSSESVWITSPSPLFPTAWPHGLQPEPSTALPLLGILSSPLPTVGQVGPV